MGKDIANICIFFDYSTKLTLFFKEKPTDTEIAFCRTDKMSLCHICIT